MRILFIALAALALSACVSDAVKPYIGKSFYDLQLDWGKPINDFRSPAGQRVVQYNWGGGTYIQPATFTGTTVIPGYVSSSPPCLVSFIMEPAGNDWRVVDARYPKDLSCG